MARIPIYQERQQASQAFAAPDLRAPDVGGGAIGRGLQQVGQGLQNLAVGQFRLDTENGKAQAAKTFGEVQNEFVSLLQTEKETAQPGAKDFTPTFTSKLQKRRDEILANETDPFSRKFLEQSLNQLGQTLSREAMSFEATEMRGNRINNVKSGIDENSSSILQNPNPQLVKQTYGQQKALIDSMALLPREKRELDDYLRTQLAQAYVGSLAVKNPRALVGMAGGVIEGTKLTPSTVRDATVNFILESEGSEYVADDAGAGESKYGITAQFNPGVDVKNLTREGAAQIYREKYWSAVDGDNLPPALAAVMADTAVNLGAGRAKELLQQSGGDVAKLLDLRREHYKTLIANNPEKYGKFEKGWMNRVNRLEAFVASSDVRDVPTVDVTKTAPENNPTSENILQWLPIPQQLSYLRQAQTVIKQDQALVEKQFKERINNANAMAVDGIQDPKRLTSADFFKAFEPDEAAKQFANYETNQKLAATMSTFKTQSASEISTELSLWQPEPGEDYAIAEKRFNILQQAAVRIAEQRKKDPVAYVASTNSRIAELQDQIATTYATAGTEGQRAQLTREYATASLAEQERLGIADPKILSNPEVDFLSRRIGAGKESSADIVASLEQQYGREYFPKVMNELMQKGKLSPALMIIPDLESSDSREIVSRLSAMKRSDLDAGVAPTIIKDIKEQVTTHIKVLQLSAGPMSVGMSQQLGAYQDIMERIAIDRVGRGVDKSGSAAADAANKILLGKYQFRDTLRMPENVDSGDVTTGLNIALKQSVLAELTINDVPLDKTRSRKPDEALAEWKSDIQSRYMWIANNETTKAMLWVRGKNGEFYKVNKDGEQYGITYEDATAKGKMQFQQVQETLKRGF
jgi:lysozyme family protein